MMNAQQAMRAHQNAKGLNSGSRLMFEELIEAGYFSKTFNCPDGNPYLCDNTIPEVGKLYFRCSNPQHMQFDHESW
jgi:hypothetical protein